MKKKMVLALALVLLVVAGCGKNATPGGNQGGNTPQASNPSSGGTNGTTPTAPSSGGNSSGNSGGSTTPNQTDKPKYEKKDQGPFKVGETAKVGPLEMKVTSVAVKKKAPGLPANTSLAFVLVLVSIKNTGPTEYPINLGEHYKFINAEAKSYPYNLPATNTEQKRLTGAVKPGESVEAYIGFMPKLIAGTNKFVFQHPDWGTTTWEYQS